jgi:hypothetical protein
VEHDGRLSRGWRLAAGQTSFSVVVLVNHSCGRSGYNRVMGGNLERYVRRILVWGDVEPSYTMGRGRAAPEASRVTDHEKYRSCAKW